MPNLNDYHAFKSTSGSGRDGRGSGCSNHPWIWIGIIVLIIYLIGRLG